MIIWTFVLVTGLGVVIAAWMLQPPAGESQQKHSDAYLRAQKKTHKLLVQGASRQDPISVRANEASLTERRGPASSPQVPTTGVFSAPPLKPIEAGDLTLSCEGPTFFRFAHAVAQIRLRGSLCAPGAVISSDIINESNGFSATVFNVGPREFSTDYVALNSGENKIRVKHMLKDGSREEHIITLSREAASR